MDSHFKNKQTGSFVSNCEGSSYEKAYGAHGAEEAMLASSEAVDGASLQGEETSHRWGRVQKQGREERRTYRSPP